MRLLNNIENNKGDLILKIHSRLIRIFIHVHLDLEEIAHQITPQNNNTYLNLIAMQTLVVVVIIVKENLIVQKQGQCNNLLKGNNNITQRDYQNLHLLTE